MRQQLLDLIKDAKTISYRVSNELPYQASGTPLYLKNPKTLYVDQEQNTIETMVEVLNQVNIYNKVISIRVYFANDAKQEPRDRMDLMLALTQIKDQIPGDYHKREIIISNNYENDMDLTTIEYRFNTIYKE